MTEKRCPKCRLYNPPTAQRCDCGYDFGSGEMKGSYLSAKQIESREQVGAGEIAFAIFLPLIGLIYGIVLVARGKDRDRKFITISVVSAVVHAVVSTFTVLLRK